MITFFKSFHNRFRLSVFLAVALTIFLATTVILIEFETITKTVSTNYAEVYTAAFVKEIESIIGPEIILSKQMIQTPSIIEWLKDDTKNLNKARAFNDLIQYNTLFHDTNIFMVSDKTKNFYMMDSNTTIESFNYLGILNPAAPDDIWYFETQKLDTDYQLNIDVDRFLNTMRVWLNMKVYDENQVFIGIMGTGIQLDTLISDLFVEQEDKGAMVLIINEYGAIQLSSNISNIKENSFGEDTSLKNTIFEYINSSISTQEIKNYLDKDNQSTVMQLSHESFQLVALAPIKDTNWYVATLYNNHSLYSIENFLPFILIVISIIILFTIGLNQLVNQLFMKPFDLLNTSIEAKEYNRDSRIYGIERHDEFGTLARSIDSMTNRLIQTVPMGMFLLSQDGHLIFANPYFINQFESDSLETLRNVVNNNLKALFKNESDSIHYMDQLSLCKDTLHLEYELLSRKNKVFWAEIHLTKIYTQHNQIQYEGILINVQSKKDYELSLVTLASTDRLTGLKNRLYFDQVVEEEMQRCDRYNHPLTMILFDLDHFKTVNDTYGHSVGDEVLITISTIAIQNVRKTDMLARWGGEEIAILMPETTKEGAAFVAEKIRVALENTSHEIAGTITASFGIAERSQNELYTDWFRRVDDCVFAAKNMGRNSISIADSSSSFSHGFVRLIWQSRFNSGNPVIDQDHIKLFSLTNAFMDASFQENSSTPQVVLFEELIQHILLHFQNEEEIIRNTDFPTDLLEAHKIRHTNLLNLCNELMDELINNKKVATEVFHEILNEVIIGHIIKEDNHYFAYTRQSNI